MNRDFEEISNRLRETMREVRALNAIIGALMKGKTLPYELKPFYISKADDKVLGDLMTIAEFENNVHSGLFIDYDGHGRFATLDQESNIRVTPSIYFHLIQYIDTKVLTHVIWFNR